MKVYVNRGRQFKGPDHPTGGRPLDTVVHDRARNPITLKHGEAVMGEHFAPYAKANGSLTEEDYDPKNPVEIVANLSGEPTPKPASARPNPPPPPPPPGQNPKKE